MNRTLKRVLIAVGALVALWLIAAVVVVITDSGDEQPASASPAPAATTPAPTATPKSQSTPEPPSETQAIARDVEQAFHDGFDAGGDESQQPSWYAHVTGFADDLDPIDGSIEVQTDLDVDDVETARSIGMGVLGAASEYVCKVDVMSSSGQRIVEHEGAC